MKFITFKQLGYNQQLKQKYPLGEISLREDIILGIHDAYLPDGKTIPNASCILVSNQQPILVEGTIEQNIAKIEEKEFS